MSKLKKIIIHISLWGIICFLVLSIYGAFIGAERARAFFNSPALTVFWVLLTVLLIAGFFAFKRLMRHRGMMFIHLGCVLVFAGGLYGSESAHKLRGRFLGKEKVFSSQMLIYEGQQENRVYIAREDKEKELPFYIRLDDFRMEYYKPGKFFVETEDGQRASIDAEVGNSIDLVASGKLTIIATYENCKIEVGKGNVRAVEGPGSGSNPALAVEIEKPDGAKETKYIFEKFPGSVHGQTHIYMRYVRMVSDYISDLKVVVDDNVVAQKSIEVNKPLHYGGYHFYQSSYDEEGGLYTVLSVTSDSGLYLVYAGYLLLSVGCFWHFWLRNAFKVKKKTGAADGD